MSDPTPLERPIPPAEDLSAAAAPWRLGGASTRLARLGVRQGSWLAPGVIGVHLVVVALAGPSAAADPLAEPRPPADDHRGSPIFVVSIANPTAPAAPVPAVAPAVPAPVRVSPPPRAPAASPPVAADAVAAPDPSTRDLDRSTSPSAATTAAAANAASAEPPDQGGETGGLPVAVAAAGTAVPRSEAGPQAGLPRAPELPVYPTRIPAPAALQYDLRRGLFSGTGELSWQPSGDRYAARLEGRVAGLMILEWSSEGGFDAAGLAPTRYLDRRRNGNRQAANFQREIGRVSYSGPSVEYALPIGAQDRLSWMLQIAAIAEARPAAVVRDASVTLWVSGARGDADIWVFRSLGVQTVELPGGPIPAVKLLRQPRQPHDTRVEVWLDPSRSHLPVRARLVNGRNDEDALELTLRR